MQKYNQSPLRALARGEIELVMVDSNAEPHANMFHYVCVYKTHFYCFQKYFISLAIHSFGRGCFSKISFISLPASHSIFISIHCLWGARNVINAFVNMRKWHLMFLKRLRTEDKRIFQLESRRNFSFLFKEDLTMVIHHYVCVYVCEGKRVAKWTSTSSPTLLHGGYFQQIETFTFHLGVHDCLSLFSFLFVFFLLLSHF